MGIPFLTQGTHISPLTEEAALFVLSTESPFLSTCDWFSSGIWSRVVTGKLLWSTCISIMVWDGGDRCFQRFSYNFVTSLLKKKKNPNRTFLLLVFPGLSWSPAMESLKNCKGVVFILETEQEKLPGRAYSSGTLKCSPTCIVGGKQMLFPGLQAVESPTRTCNSYHGLSTHTTLSSFVCYPLQFSRFFLLYWSSEKVIICQRSHRSGDGGFEWRASGSNAQDLSPLLGAVP